MAKGINVRCSQGELVFDAFLQDAAGNLVNSGNTYFRLYRVIGASGTIESFDWNDANFKQSTLTTENLSASHRKGNNGTRDTGLWTTRLSNLQNFSQGDICYLQIDNTYASPKIQTQKFQFGSAEGDMTVNSSGFLNVNVNSWRDSIPEILQTGMVHTWSTNTGSSSSGSSDVNVVSWGGVSVPALVSGMLPVLVNDYNVDKWPLQPATARRTLNVTSLGRAGINWGDIENQSSSANLSNTFIYGLFQNLSNVNITGWLGLPPNALNTGRVDVHVGSMGTDTITSTALASNAVSEIQTGLATGPQIDSISGKFDNLSVNVSGWRGLQPAVLNSSRVDVYVGDMAADTINSTTLATSAVTEINSSMPTLSDLLSISGKFNNLSVNISGWRGIEPAILNSNRVNVYVEDMAANVINSTALASSAVTEIQDGLARQSDIISISGLIQSPTGILNVNVIQWSGQSVSPLISGNAPSIVKGYLVGEIPLKGVVETRKVDVTSSGTIGINWGNIENKTSRVLLTNTSISGVDNSVSGTVNANVIQWLGSGVNSLVSGYMPSIVQMYASGQVPLKPTVENRTLDVTSNGNAGIDWSNIENPTSPVNLVNTSVSGVNYFTLGNISVNVSGWRGLSPNVLQNGRVDGYVGDMATDVLNAAALASDAVSEIQNGLSTTSQILSISGYLPRLDVNVSTRLAPSVTGRTLDVTVSGTTGINWGNVENPTRRNLLTNTSISGVDNSVSGTVNANVIQWLGSGVNGLISGYMPSIVQMYASGQVPLKPTVENRTLDVTSNGNAGIDWSNIDNPTSPVNLVNTSISGVNYLSLSNISVNVSGWRGLQPNVLINGRVDSSVGSMQADVLTASALATDAVTEINSGMPTLTDLLSVSGRFNSLSANVSGWLGLPPNILVAGRVDGYVGAMGTDTLTSTALATSAVTEIQTGLATNQDILSISGKFNNLSVNISGWRGLQPNSLQTGRVDAYVGAMGTDVLNAAALASDTVTEIQNGLAKQSDIISISGYLNKLDVPISTRLAPSVTGRTLDVTVSGTAGINWGNIENKNYTALLTSTSISGMDNLPSGTFDANIVKWRGETPDVLATGMVHSYINGLTGNTDVNVISWNGTSVTPLISGLLPVLVNDYNVGKWPLQPIVDNRKIDVSTSGYVGIFANLDKENYILGPSGLEYISVVHPTGVASTFREMNIQTWRRFYKKTTLNAASGIITFDNDNTTIITRQSVSDNGTTQTQFSS